MSNITLHIDETMEKEIEGLKKHYNASSKAEVFRKSLALLKVASQVEETNGELIARKGDKETKIIIR
jgi:hypothetical protein